VAQLLAERTVAGGEGGLEYLATAAGGEGADSVKPHHFMQEGLTSVRKQQQVA
jgi:hypothetical protein